MASAVRYKSNHDNDEEGADLFDVGEMAAMAEVNEAAIGTQVQRSLIEAPAAPAFIEIDENIETIETVDDEEAPIFEMVEVFGIEIEPIEQVNENEAIELELSVEAADSGGLAEMVETVIG